jgi:hypothetical protein
VLVGLVASTWIGLAGPAAAAEPVREKLDEGGFVSIFNGASLDGWHVSSQTGHSAASKNQSGGPRPARPRR